jgi:hypothetical protein
MKRLYAQWVNRLGDSTDLIEFDRRTDMKRRLLPTVHVAVWAADDDEDVTAFATLGMSELTMRSGLRSELTLGCRARLDARGRRELAAFVANVAQYPFHWDRSVDVWERLANPGVIPTFPGCTQLLFAPAFSEDPFDTFAAPDDDVRLLYAIPITPHENHLLAEHGREPFLSYVDEHEIDLFAPRSD